MTVNLKIDGMMCDGCVRRVEKLLARVGVADVHSVSIGEARLELSEAGPTLQTVVQSLESAGYRVTTE